MLEGFHHRVEIHIGGKTDWYMVDGEWELPPVVHAPYIAGLWPIKYYIQQWQAAVAVNIS